MLTFHQILTKKLTQGTRPFFGYGHSWKYQTNVSKLNDFRYMIFFFLSESQSKSQPTSILERAVYIKENGSHL